MISISLPWPPSTNNLFVNHGKLRVPSKGYKAWRKVAGEALRDQNPNCLFGRYTLALVLRPPTTAPRDLDNFIKAVSDLLVSHHIIESDHLARRITAEWSDLPPAKPGRVTIKLEAA